MLNKLESIVLQKKKEIENLYQKIKKNPNHPLANLLNNPLYSKIPLNFKKAIQATPFFVIAEIKRRSPSQGLLAEISHPVALAERYISSDANALSVLTDKLFFGGSFDDLNQVTHYATKQNIPVLCKDFILDEIQIAKAVLAGASAILLIVALLGVKTKKLLQFAHTLKLDVLVEIHNEEELNMALSSGAKIIGVNNRNLKTLMVDKKHAFSLKEKIPDHIIKIAESGITEPSLAKEYYHAGFNGVLIGKALIQSNHPENFIKACRDGSSFN